VRLWCTRANDGEFVPGACSYTLTALAPLRILRHATASGLLRIRQGTWRRANSSSSSVLFVSTAERRRTVEQTQAASFLQTRNLPSAPQLFRQQQALRQRHRLVTSKRPGSKVNVYRVQPSRCRQNSEETRRRSPSGCVGIETI
jgi:hypothetical protein